MELAFALATGLVIGSFLNVCILRLPLGISISVPRSQCPHCKKVIPWYDNIPILSYVMLGGQCRRCRKRISARYPFIEGFSGLVSVLLYLKFGLGMSWIIFFAFCSALLVLAFIDLDHRILPDAITLNGIWIGVLASVYLAQPNPLIAGILGFIGIEAANPRIVAFVGSVLGMVVAGGLLWGVAEAYLRLRGIEGMGFGDIKMMAMVGAFLGAPLALLTIMIGSFFGALIGSLFIHFVGKSREYELPFGTFLSFAAIIAVLYGEGLIRLYVDSMIRPAL